VTIFDSLDGGYLLLTETWDGDEPPMPGGPGLNIGSADDIACISTFGTWEDLFVFASVLPMRNEIRQPHGWEATATATFDVTGRLLLADLEFEPHGEPLDLRPGKYLLEVYASSAEHVRGMPQLWIEEDRPTEQHLVQLSPVKARG
jgi:hypothetical protein